MVKIQPKQKRRGCSKYLLSIEVTVGEEAIPAKIVCVRNKSKKKDWLAIISTDIGLSEEEIIRINGKRWGIEVFFKSYKSYLHLVKECRSLSYDALTANVSIVFTRYMMLSVAQRRKEDDKTICELFFFLLDELDDITFSQSMRIIIDALMDTVIEYFHITEHSWKNSLPALFSVCLNICKLHCYMGNIPHELLFVC